MTDMEQSQLKKDLVFEHHQIGQELKLYKVKMEKIGEKLEKLGRALKQNPSKVTDAEPNLQAGHYEDFRDDLSALNRDNVVNSCKRMAELQESLKKTEQQMKELGLL
jgi:hypothetical protein